MFRARAVDPALRRFAGALVSAGPPVVWAALTVLAALVPLSACGKARPPAIVTTPDAGDVTVDAGSAFTVQSLGCGAAGTQTTVAVSGTKVGFVSLAQTGMTQMCTIMPMQGATSSNPVLWNVCYAESSPDGTYTSKVITQQPYTANTGAGLAYDAAGNPTVAYFGVGSTPAMEVCGSNDAFVTTASGGTFGTPVQVSNGSMSDGLVMGTPDAGAGAGGVAEDCTMEQDVCDKGDVTGLWPAVGIDSSGNTLVAYRDLHFGFAMDDKAKSDVELAEGSGSSYQVLTVDVSRGGGTYNRMAFTPAGLPAILHYDQTGMMPGVYIDVQLMPGGLSTQEATGGWGSAQVSIGPVGEQLGFGINSKGLFAAAYYDMGTSRLLYTESMDGMTWTTATSVDLDGTTGLYPSLAFDSMGEPAIAYYRCSAQEGAGTNCDDMTDGLMLARRTGTQWTAEQVVADPKTQDGLYPALAFVNDKAVIAYQVSSFDPVSMKSSVTWMVAEGQ